MGFGFRRYLPVLMAVCLGLASLDREAIASKPSAPMQGKITRVLNGDTLQFNAGGKSMRLQLYGIDAPEEGQPMAREARAYLERLALYQPVTVQIKAKDMYKRFIAQVSLSGGRSLSQEMLKAGYAWWYRKYAGKDASLQSLEASARKARLGLWTQSSPVPPWEFRELSEGRH